MAFAERDRHVADPGRYQAPLEKLLSKEFAAVFRERLDPVRAMPTPQSLPAARERPTLPSPTGKATWSPVSKACLRGLVPWSSRRVPGSPCTTGDRTFGRPVPSQRHCRGQTTVSHIDRVHGFSG